MEEERQTKDTTTNDNVIFNNSLKARWGGYPLIIALVVVAYLSLLILPLSPPQFLIIFIFILFDTLYISDWSPGRWS
jgi:hypothetical protein